MFCITLFALAGTRVHGGGRLFEFGSCIEQDRRVRGMYSSCRPVDSSPVPGGALVKKMSELTTGRGILGRRATAGSI
jgi:hypothetical protein